MQFIFYFILFIYFLHCGITLNISKHFFYCITIESSVLKYFTTQIIHLFLHPRHVIDMFPEARPLIVLSEGVKADKDISQR